MPSFFNFKLLVNETGQKAGLCLAPDGNLAIDCPAYPELAKTHWLFGRPVTNPKPHTGGRERSFWINGLGLRRVSEQLNIIFPELTAKNISIAARAVTMKIPEADAAACYSDAWQYDFYEEKISPSAARLLRDYRDYDLIINPFMLVPEHEAYQCPSCGVFFSERPAVSRNNGAPICPDCAMREALRVAGMNPEQEEEIVRTAWQGRRNALL